MATHVNGVKDVDSDNDADCGHLCLLTIDGGG